MDDKRKYDPEDIESLLMHKEFEELYPEEKTFILEHLDSSDEYESMRKTLLTVMAASNDHDRITPDPAIKDSLLAEFGTQKRGGFTVWLNSVLAWMAPPKIEWYRKPAYQMAFASIALLIGVFVFLPGNQEVRFADAKKPSDATVNAAPTNELDKVESAPTKEEMIESSDAESLTDKADYQTEMDYSIVTGEANAASEAVSERAVNEGSFQWDVAPELAENNEIDLSKDDVLDGSMTIDFDDEALAEDIRLYSAESEDFQDVKIADGVEEELQQVEVTVEKASTRAATPAMVDDVAMDLSEMRDDAIGNSMIGEIETVTLSSVEVASDAGIATGNEVDFQGESLFSKKTAGIPVQASTRKYRDLIDLLYTAM